MPPRKPRAPRAPKCAYVEDGRRCTANGVGNPPLCPPHAAILRATAEAPYNPMKNVIDAIKTGGKVSVGDAVAAAADILSTMLGARPFAPPQVPTGEPYRPGHGPPPQDSWDPFSQWRQQWQQQGPRPRVDADELVAARAAARKVFGWSNTYLLVDADILKARYRELAKKNHPDRGGSAEKMAKINHAMDILTAELESR